MRFDLVSVMPDMFRALTEQGVCARALKRDLAELVVWNPRDFTADVHRTVDDRPYGGGPGMVMMAEPLEAAIKAAKAAAPASRVAYLSPQGRRFDQHVARELAERSGMILVAGRYEGIDERVIESEVDEEWSIGDYVISGGELAAAVIVDAVARLLPGVLGDEQSAVEDSFVDGLLDHPHYTRPETVEGKGVPPVLLSGDHAAIERWRRKQSLGRTWLRRPELLAGLELDAESAQLLAEFQAEHDEGSE